MLHGILRPCGRKTASFDPAARHATAIQLQQGAEAPTEASG
jgi:hypothetical protein